MQGKHKSDAMAYGVSAKEETKQQSKALEDPKNPNGSLYVVVALVFSTMDHVEAFARNLREEELPANSLIRLKDSYYIIMNVSDCEEKQVERISFAAEEFVSDIWAGAEKMAYLMEHGKVILKERAIEQLRML